MTVSEFIKLHPNQSYVLQDRMRIPIREEELKGLDLAEIILRNAEMKDGIYYLHTDYIADQC